MNSISILKINNGWIVYIGGDEHGVRRSAYVAETLENLHKIIDDLYTENRKEEKCQAEQ